MMRIAVFLIVTLCGLEARSPAQVHLGVSLGERVAAHVAIGPVSVHVGSRYRDRSRHHLRRSCARSTWVTQRVWVPARYDEVYSPAEYRSAYDSCGRSVQILVRPAHYERVSRPGYWKYERRRVRSHGHH